MRWANDDEDGNAGLMRPVQSLESFGAVKESLVGCLQISGDPGGLGWLSWSERAEVKRVSQGCKGGCA